MANRIVIRLALRCWGVLACLIAFAARPAQACYCVEQDSCEAAYVVAPSGDGETPLPNTYVVTVTWTELISDCTYDVTGTPEAGGTVPESCTVTDEVVVNGKRERTAECDVTVTGDPADAVNWTFNVTGNDKTSCNITIPLPGPIGPPVVVEVVRDTANPTEATIAWKAAAGRDDGTGRTTIVRYDVYRSSAEVRSSGSLAKIASTTVTSFTDHGLFANTTYHYEIYPVDKYGQGEALTVDVPVGGTAATDPFQLGSGGCSSAGSLVGPLGLALLAASAFWRRRRSRA